MPYPRTYALYKRPIGVSLGTVGMWLRLVVLSAAPAFCAAGQAPRLSDSAKVSLLTCAPWQGELYTAFGHSAIRVYDPLRGINHVFNYGVFDFTQKHFYLNFARGDMRYELEVSSYPDFIYMYLVRERSIEEQELNLTLRQRQKVFDFLHWNAQPENKSYAYDYFYDNCATRIRDVFTRTLGEELRWDSAFIKDRPTIRQLAERYMAYQPWGDLGIDLCLGLPMDKRASAYDHMFLPDYVSLFVDHATLISADSVRPLARLKRSVMDFGPSPSFRSWPHPWIVFGALLLLAVGVSVRDVRRGVPSMWLDATLLGAAGLLGVLLALLWAATSHRASAYNFNLMWALPTHLLLPFLGARSPRWTMRYFGFAFWLAMATLALWPWLPQQLNPFLIPVVGTLAIRYGLNYRLRRRALQKL